MSRPKQVKFIIFHCDACPYCKWDQSLGEPKHAGLDCTHPKVVRRRIVSALDRQTFTDIPEWCPLEDVLMDDLTEG